MKKRIGFVSNSSSTSFIYIGDEIIDLEVIREDYIKKYCSLKSNWMFPEQQNLTLEIGKTGKVQFGWENESSYDFNSKLNYLYLTCCYSLYKEKNKEALYKALRKIFGPIVMESKITEDDIEYCSCHIDHQSAYDGAFILEDEELIIKFLCNPKSYIKTGNDNDYEYYEPDEEFEE